MVRTFPVPIIGQNAASSAQVIDGSLKFQNDLSTYLTRTPGSAGNRSNYTGSVWVKRTEFAPENNSNSNAFNYTIFTAGTSSANNSDQIKFYKNAGTDDANKIEYSSYVGSYQYLIYTNAKYRDPNAWYNIVWNYNGTEAKLYVNGEQVTSFDTNTQNGGSSGHFNNNVEHVIGHTCDQNNSSQFDGYMSQFYWIDGLALGPQYFGFTDPLTGTWRPKKFIAEGTTYNNGTVWSSGSTVTGGTIANADKGFDGSLAASGYCNLIATNTNTTANVTFAADLKNVRKLEVFAHSTSSSGDTRGTCQTAGGQTYTSNTLTSASQDFHTIYEGPEIDLINVGWGINQNGQTGTTSDGFRAFRVNGEILIDSTTTNLDFGTNGFYLPFDGNTPIGEDQSGNNNDWTAQNFDGTVSDPDVVKDSPSGAAFGGPGSSGITTTSSGPANYCTLNPIDAFVSTKDGNLETVNSSGWQGIRATLGMKSGKFYWETQNNQDAAAILGIADTAATGFVDGAIFGSTGHGGGDANPAWTWAGANYYFNASSAGTSLDNHTASDIVQYAFDADNGKLWFGRNGTWYSSSWATTGDPANGVNPTVSGIDTTKTYVACGTFFSGSAKFNFGQKPFKYAPPQGFLPINSASATPQEVTPRPDKFQLANSFTATGGNQIITFGFKPDLIVSKTRNQSYAWDWEDIVRGGGFKLRSNTNDAQTDYCSNAPIREWRIDGVRCSSNMNATYSGGGTTNSVSYGFVAGGNEIPNYGAISFDGTADYLKLDSTSAFRGHSGYTIDGWVYIIGAPANNNGYIIFDTGSGGSDPELNVLADGSGNLQLYDSLSNNTNWDGGAPYMQRYRWYYFKQTVEGTADDDSAAVNKLYIDGQLGVQNTVNLSGRTASSTAAIGGRTNGTVLATMILSNLRYRSVVDNSTDIPTEPFTSDSDTVLLCCNGIAPGSGNADPTDSTTTPSTITKYGNPGNANIDIFGRFTKDGVQYSSASAAGLATGGSNITPTAASIGTKTGFSIVTWNTESLSGTKSIDTGLGKKPDFVITKVLDQSDDWLTFHNGISSTESFILNGNRDKLSNAAYAHTFNDDGTISGLPVGGSNWWISNRTYVFYSWCNIPGKQKFGAYEANNDADGPFIELGFRPAILWVKRADATGSWYILDNKRDTFNRVYKTISPNQNATEDTTTGASDYCDFLSNGFKPRIAEGSINGTNTYCYCAWAESPFSNLYGGQSLAR